MVNSSRRPLRSRDDRAAAPRIEEIVQAPPAGSEAEVIASPESNANGPDDTLAEARRLADSHGMVLARQRQPRGVRPQVQGGNKVRTTCYISLPVRHAMELARLELDMHMSDIIEASVIHYLQAQGLQVEGLPDS